MAADPSVYTGHTADVLTVAVWAGSRIASGDLRRHGAGMASGHVDTGALNLQQPQQIFSIDCGIRTRHGRPRRMTWRSAIYAVSNTQIPR